MVIISGLAFKVCHKTIPKRCDSLQHFCRHSAAIFTSGICTTFWRPFGALRFLPSPIKKHVRFLHDALDMLLTLIKGPACDCRDGSLAMISLVLLGTYKAR